MHHADIQYLYLLKKPGNAQSDAAVHYALIGNTASRQVADRIAKQVGHSLDRRRPDTDRAINPATIPADNPASETPACPVDLSLSRRLPADRPGPTGDRRAGEPAESATVKHAIHTGRIPPVGFTDTADGDTIHYQQPASTNEQVCRSTNG